MAQPAAPDPAASTSAGVEGSFPALPDSVAAARMLVGGWLRAAMPGEDLLAGDVALAVSEACTNVIMHAYPNGDSGGFQVAARQEADTVTVVVSDQGSGMVPRPDSPGLGLGLPLIASLTDGVEVRPASEGPGTVLSMRFSAAGAETRLPR